MKAVLALILTLAALGQGSVLVSRAKGSQLGRLPEARSVEENDFDRRERWMHPGAPYTAHHDGLLGDSADDHGDNVRPRGPENEWETAFWREKGKGSVESLVKRRENTGIAKNLIIFMGDGMSVPTLAATRVYMGNENQSLSFEKFPAVGLSKTYCVDTQVADSACSATAYLCGVKANMGTMGVNARVVQGNCAHQQDSSNHVDSVLAWGQRAGKWAGFVTTTRVTHASPGGTYAHIAKRDWEDDYEQKVDNMTGDCSDIAEQLVRDAPGKDFRVILGGGRRAFVPNTEDKHGHRLDGVNLIKEWQDGKKKQGKSAEYVKDKAELDKVDISKTEYLLGLFQWSHMDYHMDAAATQPTLAQMTETAIKMLSKQDKGFVLFVEGGRIDHGHHDDQAHYALDETQQFSEAVQKAADMTKEEDTLIVVTSDHAHTMSMAGYAARGNDVFQFAGTSKMDNMKYTTLSYANGPSAPVGVTRADPGTADTDQKNFAFPSTAPLDSETHGGDDVAIFARGPWSHLYTGVHEQHLIPHIMAYAARIEMFGDRPLVGAAPAAHQAALVSLLPALLVPALGRLML